MDVQEDVLGSRHCFAGLSCRTLETLKLPLCEQMTGFDVDRASRLLSVQSLASSYSTLDLMDVHGVLAVSSADQQLGF